MEASQSSDSLFTDTAQRPSVSTDTTDSKSARIPSAQPNEPKQKQDLFGNDDLFGDAKISLSKSSGAIPKTTSQPDKTLTAPAENDVKKAIGEKVKSKEPVKSSAEEEDDLFSSSKIGSTKRENKRAKKKVLPDIDDDIFSSVAKSTFRKAEKADPIEDDLLIPSTKPKKVSPAVSAVPMFEPPPLDDDDDIFASGTKKTKSAIAQVLDDDDDDDIFAGSSVAKGKTTATITTKTTAPAKDVDDDDIFADASINKPKGIGIVLFLELKLPRSLKLISD